MFRPAKQLGGSQRKPTSADFLGGLSQYPRMVSLKCFSAFILDMHLVGSWRATARRVVLWPLAPLATVLGSWEQEVACTLLCLVRTKAQQKSYYWLAHAASSVQISPLHLLDSCWSIQIWFKYSLCYRVTRILPQMLLITYLHHIG